MPQSRAHTPSMPSIWRFVSRALGLGPWDSPRRQAPHQRKVDVHAELSDRNGPPTPRLAGFVGGHDAEGGQAVEDVFHVGLPGALEGVGRLGHRPAGGAFGHGGIRPGDVQHVAQLVRERILVGPLSPARGGSLGDEGVEVVGHDGAYRDAHCCLMWQSRDRVMIRWLTRTAGGRQG